MTLVTGAACSDFVIAASDSKVTVREYSPDTLEPIHGEVYEVDFKSEKIQRLTSRVFLITSGWHAAGELIKKHMITRTDIHDDLDECSKAAEKVFSDLRDGNITPLDTQEQWAAEAINKGAYGSYLIGFDHSGVTGVKDINYGGYGKFNEQKGYPSVMLGPDRQVDSQFRYALSVPAGERTIDEFMKRIAFIHANISKVQHDLVSTDCTFHILENKNGFFEYTTQTIDTADLYEQLGLKGSQ